ncbi:hypothetical protein [Nocardia sp. XZ_19_385]|uniref:hypothetical protein n=1 Tax=Nocardia sp. XZ_19_385 TaxID=2769488 RepID=UPI00188ED617|nr:hypothetical protein [Nocardia sp. XZ_19_385]
MGSTPKSREIEQLRNDFFDILAAMQVKAVSTDANLRHTYRRVRRGNRQLGLVIAAQRQHTMKLDAITATLGEVLDLLKNPPSE